MTENEIKKDNSYHIAASNICVIGAGFVGLVTASGLAQFGHKVVCVDTDKSKIDELTNGRVPFYEPDLQQLVRDNLNKKTISFSDNLADSVRGKDVVFIAVGTPSGVDGRAELSNIDSVCRELAEILSGKEILVLKSTVPLGTSERVKKIFEKAGKDAPPVVSCPEFLREARAVHDFFYPSRILIGGDNDDAKKKIAEIFLKGVNAAVPIVSTDNKTAELVKYAANAFLATKIGFVNELAGFCDLLGVNIKDVSKYIGMDPRIGTKFMEPGPGWGGSCFMKDLSELMGLAKTKDFSLLITNAVLKANEKQFELVYEKVCELLSNIKDKKIAVLGLAFKAETSDMRYSPAIPIINKLLQSGARVIAYDPKASEGAREFIPGIDLADDAYKTAESADCLLILTEWNEFRSLDLEKLAETMNSKNIVDARNLLDPALARKLGFKYIGMGQN